MKVCYLVGIALGVSFSTLSLINIAPKEYGLVSKTPTVIPGEYNYVIIDLEQISSWACSYQPDTYCRMIIDLNSNTIADLAVDEEVITFRAFEPNTYISYAGYSKTFVYAK